MTRDRDLYYERPGLRSGAMPHNEVVAEALRASDGDATSRALPREERGMSLFWRVFGGTILSITALVGITLFNQLTQNISDMRRELNQHQEARGELVKKTEVDHRFSTLWSNFREVQTVQGGLASGQERAKTIAEQLQQQIKALEEERKDLQKKLDDSRKAIDGDHKDVLRKLEDQHKALEAERKDVERKFDDQRKALEEERKDLQRKLEEQRKLLEDDRKAMTSKLQALGERLATVEGRQAIKTVRPASLPPGD